MEALLAVKNSIPGIIAGVRERGFRPPQEFFNVQQVSRPADTNQAISRISYNTRYYSGNYSILVAILAVYALLTNWVLIIAVLFLFGGFSAINKWAPEPTQVGDYVITQKGLYIGLFVIGLPLLWLASPVSTFFWLVGSSSFMILAHASLMEPGVESEYATVQDTV
jgi:hypothetical protein